MMQRSSESGNAIFFILIAIALFAALSATLMLGSRSSVTMLSDEEAEALAYAAQEYTNTVNAAVKRLKLRGCEDSEISYETPLGNNANPNAPANERCHIFRLNGGQVKFQGPDVGPSGKRVFITSTSHDGNLGGLTGADAICNARASAAGLSGAYLAWMSDSTSSPDTRFTKFTGDYILVDNTVIANNWTDLTDGDIDSAINVTETGASLNNSVWTATSTDGTLEHPSFHCSNWTNNTGSTRAMMGIGSASSASWTNDSRERCFELASLYCFEQ